MRDITKPLGLGKDGTDGVLLPATRQVVVLSDGETYCALDEAVIVTIPDVDNPAEDEDAILDALRAGRWSPVVEGSR